MYQMNQSFELFTPPAPLLLTETHSHIQHTLPPQKAHRCPNIPLDSLTVAAVLPGNKEMSSVIRGVREAEERPSSPRLPRPDQRLRLSWTHVRHKSAWFLSLKRTNCIIRSVCTSPFLSSLKQIFLRA